MVADAIIDLSASSASLFQQGGLISSAAEAQRILDRDFPADFAKLRAP